MALRLLNDDEPAAFEVLRENGASPFLITCDHASNRIPRGLDDLGLGDRERGTHVAWDIGAAGVTAMLAADLDAVAILQNYSRLVIDCNRPLDAGDSIATLSEHTQIPANRALSAQQRGARVAEIFTPYHARITQELDRRQAHGEQTVLVAVHSFTPVFKGVPRPWHVGVLYHRDARLAHAVMPALRAHAGIGEDIRGDIVVGDNQPYTVSDESDYTIPVHGERRGLLHIEIEIRQDLIGDARGQGHWAALLAAALRAGVLTALEHLPAGRSQRT